MGQGLLEIWQERTRMTRYYAVDEENESVDGMFGKVQVVREVRIEAAHVSTMNGRDESLAKRDPEIEEIIRASHTRQLGKGAGLRHAREFRRHGHKRLH